MSKHTRPLFALIFCMSVSALPSMASAQVQIPNKWDSQQRQLIVESAIPWQCDNPMLQAVDYFESVEPAMNLSITWRDAPNPADTSTTSVMRQTLGYGANNTPAYTRKSYQSPSNFWESYGQLVDADIYVNHDFFYWPATTDTEKTYDFYCDSVSQGGFGAWQHDYRTIMSHEIGHVVGFEHRTDTLSGSCLMHEQQRRGVVNTIMCADEMAAYRNAY